MAHYCRHHLKLFSACKCCCSSKGSGNQGTSLQLLLLLGQREKGKQRSLEASVAERGGREIPVHRPCQWSLLSSSSDRLGCFYIPQSSCSPDTCVHLHCQELLGRTIPLIFLKSNVSIFKTFSSLFTIFLSGLGNSRNPASSSHLHDLCVF